MQASFSRVRTPNAPRAGSSLGRALLLALAALTASAPAADDAVLPSADEMLVETFPRGGRMYLVAYCFEGRNAHQTLGMLLTRRMARMGYGPLGFCATDYVIAVWSVSEARDVAALFDQDMLGDDLDHYTARGDAFLALTLDNEAGAVEPQQLPPLVIRYAGDQLSFPSVMARHAVDLQRTTVYVQGDSRAEVTDGWAMVDEDTVWGPAEAVPADVLDDYLADLGTQGTWLRTWSGPRGEGHLTRFDLYAPPEQHVADAVFGFDGSDQRQATTVWLEGGGQAAAWFLPLLLLGSLGATQRRR